MRSLGLSLAAALWALPGSGEGTRSDRDVFMAAVETAGCHLGVKDAGAVLAPLGLTQDATRVIVDALVAEGLASVDEMGLTLKTETCL